MPQIILASKSKFRATLLKNAGLNFVQKTAPIDEREIEASLVLANKSPAEIGKQLAIAKANIVSKNYKEELIIGCDQILEFEDKLLHKPTDMEDAKSRLLAFSGKTHQLHSAICLVKNEQLIWSNVESAKITFRKLSADYVSSHLKQAGTEILSSVGAYQIEGVGVQLFKKIKGDYFTIMGLPLISLLQQLRKLEVVDG